MMKEARGLGLQAFLVTPVQRIPRYKLLLEDMLKNTPTDHPDYMNISNALKLMSQIAKSINETIRNHEMMLKMVDIQKSLIGLNQNLLVPGRKLLKTGRVQKISRRAHQPRQFFLFTDVLVYASPAILEETFHFHRIIALKNLSVDDIPDSDGKYMYKLDVKFIFQVVNRDKSFAVYTQTLEEKMSWIETIKQAKLDLKSADGTLRKGKLIN